MRTATSQVGCFLAWTIRLLFVAQVQCATEAPVILRSNGTYGVNIVTTQLNDPTTLDPWSPQLTSRKVMVSIFYPSAQSGQCRAAFMPYVSLDNLPFWDDAFATYLVPRGTVGRTWLRVCQDDARVTTHLSEFPLVLFLPGHPVSRFNYNAMAMQTASQGAVVVSVDVPYDAPLTEFPNGQHVTGIPWPNPGRAPPRNWTDKAIVVRVEDVSFVLDQLSAPAVVQRLLPIREGRPLRTDRAIIVGHSFGGATAAVAATTDRRVAGAANLDGIFFGPLPLPPVERPFLLFGSPSHATLNDTSWPRTWPSFRDWKLELLFQGAEHFTFTDDPILLAVAGNRPANDSSLHGTIDGRRSFNAITTYITAFVNFVSKDVLSPLLRGPSSDFPDVLFNITNGTTT